MGSRGYSGGCELLGMIDLQPLCVACWRTTCDASQSGEPAKQWSVRLRERDVGTKGQRLGCVCTGMACADLKRNSGNSNARHDSGHCNTMI